MSDNVKIVCDRILDEMNVADSKYSKEGLVNISTRCVKYLSICGPASVGVVCRSSSFAAMAIVAALRTRTSVVLINPESPLEDIYSKLSLTNTTFLITEDIEYPIFYNNYSPVNDYFTVSETLSDIYPEAQVNAIKANMEKGMIDVRMYDNTVNNIEPLVIIPHNMLHLKDVKMSMIPHENFIEGLKNAEEFWKTLNSESVAYSGSFETMSDITMGIFGPILAGKMLFVNKSKGNTDSMSLFTCPKNLSTETLAPVKTPKYDNIVINGKVSEEVYKSNAKSARVGIICLYQLPEIASYLGYNAQVAKKAKVGIKNRMSLRENVGIYCEELVAGKQAMSLFINCNDMSIGTNKSFAEADFNSNPKAEGMFNTRDVVIPRIEGDDTYFDLIGKDTHVLVNEEGDIVDLNDFSEFAKKRGFVKDARAVASESGKLIVLVVPDIKWAKKHKASYDDIMEMCSDLKDRYEDDNIFVSLYKDAKGFDENTLKLYYEKLYNSGK